MLCRVAGVCGLVAFALATIRLYQQEISPRRRPCCRFSPTCSHYAAEAIERHGARRLVRIEQYVSPKAVRLLYDRLHIGQLAAAKGVGRARIHAAERGCHVSAHR